MTSNLKALVNSLTAAQAKQAQRAAALEAKLEVSEAQWKASEADLLRALADARGEAATLRGELATTRSALLGARITTAAAAAAGDGLVVALAELIQLVNSGQLAVPELRTSRAGPGVDSAKVNALGQANFASAFGAYSVSCEHLSRLITQLQAVDTPLSEFQSAMDTARAEAALEGGEERAEPHAGRYPRDLVAFAHKVRHIRTTLSIPEEICFEQIVSMIPEHACSEAEHTCEAGSAHSKIEALYSKLTTMRTNGAPAYAHQAAARHTDSGLRWPDADGLEQLI